MARETFAEALTAVLRHEGGYADHPRDPGGATMMGITQATLAEWRGRPVSEAEVRTLTRTEVSEIYRARYWNAIRADELPPGLDLAVFDLSVNSGPSRAARQLQSVLGVPVDGRIGPITLKAAQDADVTRIISAFSAARLAFLGRLSTFPVFGRGWSRRVHDIEAEALKLATGRAAPNPLPPTKKEKTMDSTEIGLTKTIFTSRTIWANGIGFLALALSWFGFDTSGIDRVAVTDQLLQGVAGISFVASTVFRVLATKRLV